MDMLRHLIVVLLLLLLLLLLSTAKLLQLLAKFHKEKEHDIISCC